MKSTYLKYFAGLLENRVLASWLESATERQMSDL